METNLGGVICFQYKNHQELLNNGIQINRCSIYETNLTLHKIYAYQMLYGAGVSIPKTIFIGLEGKVSRDIHHYKLHGPFVGLYIGKDMKDVTTSENIITLIQEKLNYPNNGIYIKRDAYGNGHGIGCCEKNPTSERTISEKQKNDIFKAIHRAFETPSGVIIQEAIEAKEYRFYVLYGTVYSVYERSSPFVNGDGQHTIKELIEIENSTTSWRRLNSNQIIIDEELKENLNNKYTLNLESIPEKKFSY